MTRRGYSPAPESVLKRLALLMQIHLLTHPERTAREYGFSAEYVRRQWRNMPVGELEECKRRLAKALED